MGGDANSASSHPNWVTEDNKYPFTIATADWDDYAAHRPQLPASMFALWLQYHKSHGGNFDTAHDIGAGTLRTPPTTNSNLVIPARHIHHTPHISNQPSLTPSQLNSKAPAQAQQQ